MKEKFVKKIKNKKQAGFTIVESLVAIFILIISITGPMAFTQSGLRAAFVSRDQITAFYLAQDAIEYIKNVRDNNAIKLLDIGVGNDPEDGWIDGLSNCFVTDISQSGCSVDTLRENINRCPTVDGCLGSNPDGSNDAPLKIREIEYDDKIYEFLGIGSTGDRDSIFSREIKMIEKSPNEVEINVFVRWNTNETIGSREIVVKEYIYNWAAGF